MSLKGLSQNELYKLKRSVGVSNLNKKAEISPYEANKIILKESTSYYKNGQMSYKVEYDSNGLNMRKTWWYNNGQKSWEGTYKDGELISKKEWNDDGSVKE